MMQRDVLSLMEWEVRVGGLALAGARVIGGHEVKERDSPKRVSILSGHPKVVPDTRDE